MKKILVLGGTQFIGRNLVERLHALRTYELTLFNRQKTQANLFPEIQKIKGDRETDDVAKIANKKWDFVIDCSCFFPNSFEQLLKHVNPDLEKYILISSCSTYNNEDNFAELKNEESPVKTCAESEKADRTDLTYGNRKSECDRVLKASGLKHAIFRPALVYGRYDHSDRFYYWLYQVKHNNPLLMPDKGERKFSITYVHDLVNAIVFALTNDVQGIFNVITEPQISIGEIVETAANKWNKNPDLIDATPAFLHANNITQWADMPLWINGDYFTYTNKKLVDAFGIAGTDFKQSVAETMAHYDARGWDSPIYGISESKRLALLDLLNPSE